MTVTNPKLFEKILLIEDDSSHAMLIRRALGSLAGEVSISNSIDGARQQIKHLHPDIVITDLQLPDSQKLAHIKELSNNPQSIPLVVLTSSTSISDAVEAMQLGAKDFIVKNFDVNFKEVLSFSLARIAAQTLLEKETKQLQREMLALRGAIEYSQDAFAVMDLKGDIAYCNSALKNFVERCGGSSQNISEMFSDVVIKSQALIENLREKLNSLSVGSVWNSEVTFANNKALAYDLSLSIISKEDDQVGQAVIWVRDISEQKRREKFQREILSTTTHDLKGPLGTIALCSEILEDMSKGQDKLHEFVLRIASAARGAINLIDEFLSARRIQEGTFILKPAQYDTADIIDQVVQDFTAMAQSKKLTLNLDVGPTPLLATVDKIGLIRVASNLITNAIKFTPKGGTITVRARIQADELHLWIADTGAGMEPSEVARIFELYSRLDKHSQVDGTGIGLFIVKSIVSAHGGKIDVTSKLGSGTTFEITLPLNPPVNERGELMSLNFA